jgi:leucyl aminopeptidase (aminopeptidase T)
VIIKQEQSTEPSSSVAAAAAAPAAVAAVAATAAAAQQTASQQQQQQHDTVAAPAPAAAAQGLPNLDVAVTVNITEARKEITGMLVQYEQLGPYISQLWSLDTDTLQKFVAVIRAVLDTGLLSAEQQQRVSVLHLVLSHGAP